MEADDRLACSYLILYPIVSLWKGRYLLHCTYYVRGGLGSCCGGATSLCAVFAALFWAFSWGTALRYLIFSLPCYIHGIAESY
ncbi:hypothetical protein F4801DRAFT_540443 [Xylaria longipes]|nr:hypothetical protein F4801DRAFT_540443 [Xylaria longipes]